jgi:two-component system, chemotaxis family, sensor histidine kinase and response regulator WspE
MSSGLEDFSLFELFRMEAEEQVRVLQAQLIEVESGEAKAATLEGLMRASHSLKGAARIVGLDVIVHLTHAMEDRFVAAQAGKALKSSDIDLMLAATDWLAQLQNVAEGETASWLENNSAAIEACAGNLRVEPPEDIPQVPVPGNTASTETETHSSEPSAPSLPSQPRSDAARPSPLAPKQTEATLGPGEDIFSHHQQLEERGSRERTVRMAADRFDSIVSLSAETLVAARQLAGCGEALERTRRVMAKALQALEDAEIAPDKRTTARRDLEVQLSALSNHLADLDQVVRANELTAEQLYRAALAGRLRPFSEGITGVARLVRDTARSLSKQVRVEIVGENTRIDRDILEKLEAPISHLITNAIDHGIEAPADRAAAGKPAEANLRLHARHENGRLVVTVRDDGRGIDIERVRERVIERKLAAQETAEHLSESELLEFLFLPGFSTREAASIYSGRGVGMNVVQSMVQEAGGSVLVTNTVGVGTVFRLTLPVTRSVVRVIRVAVAGELYAIPMVRIDHVACVEPEKHEGKSVVVHNGRVHPIIALASLLGLGDGAVQDGAVPLLLSGGFGFAVDRLVDQTELSVRRLDSRLGKIPGVSAASLDENGDPLLILDLDDLIQTAAGHSATIASVEGDDGAAPHILVVDDSHTVREMERRLLVRAGYTVTAAMNGQEAWNLLRLNDYDLLISDVDMPQMNGIELVTRVRENPRLARLPIVILSYKDREEDRRRGLEAGADFYLTKGSFDNGRFLQAVVDLVGEAAPMSPGDPA